jgi:hypothetical protein
VATFIDESGVCPDVTKSGYAVLRIQPRGTGRSGGIAPEEMSSLADREDCRTAIEWAAAQPRCNGAVSMTDMLYCAIAQLLVAATRPPIPRGDLPPQGDDRRLSARFLQGVRRSAKSSTVRGVREARAAATLLRVSSPAEPVHQYAAL